MPKPILELDFTLKLAEPLKEEHYQKMKDWLDSLLCMNMTEYSGKVIMQPDGTIFQFSN